VSASHDPVREPFAGPEHQRDTATLGTWVFLAQELMFFAALFVWYAYARLRVPDEFVAGSRATLWPLGVTMTALLLLSSASVVFAVRFAEQRRRWATSLALGLTIALGLAFLVIKLIEYDDHLTHGQLPGGPHGRFWAVYYVCTGFHALHVLVGLGLLSALLVAALRQRLRTNTLAMSALFWHLVDVVWIFLFPLLYLIDPKP
jgi:cytochrome c oxidase subunit 3